MTCAFTGHRPKRLPWGVREDDPRCQALKMRLRVELELLAANGYRRFLCGMALGCDTYFAEAVLELKQTNPQILLEAMIPCPGQADRWTSADRARYHALIGRCDRVWVLEDSYSDGCMQRRNRAMVDRADLLLSVWDGGSGGTGSTVRYAQERGVDVLAVWA